MDGSIDGWMAMTLIAAMSPPQAASWRIGVEGGLLLTVGVVALLTTVDMSAAASCTTTAWFKALAALVAKRPFISVANGGHKESFKGSPVSDMAKYNRS